MILEVIREWAGEIPPDGQQVQVGERKLTDCLGSESVVWFSSDE
jgi:hypothetical protein